MLIFVGSFVEKVCGLGRTMFGPPPMSPDVKKALEESKKASSQPVVVRSLVEAKPELIKMDKTPWYHLVESATRAESAPNVQKRKKRWLVA